MAFENFFTSLSQTAQDSDYTGIFGTTGSTLSLSANLNSLSGEGAEIVKWVRYRLGEPRDGSKVVCLICGKLFETITQHVPRIHNIKIEKYKEMFPGCLTHTKRLAKKYASCATAGKIYTQEERDKISKATKEAMKRPEVREKYEKSMKRVIESGEFGKHISEGIKRNSNWANWNIGRKLSREHREKLSKAQLKRIEENPESIYSYGNSGHYYCGIKDKIYFYRSNFELIALQILSKMLFEEKIKNFLWEREHKIKIVYEEIKRYIPDVLIIHNNDERELIEIKPKFKLKDKKIILKNKATIQYCKNNFMKFSIWDEDILEENHGI